MQKSSTLFIIVVGMVCVGIVLSFYGNQIMFENLDKAEGDVRLGEELKIVSELNEGVSKKGVYAIQILDFKKGVISANVYDPLGTEIESQEINEEIFEGEFDIVYSGSYQLVIKSTDQERIKVFGVIGHEPDAGMKSLGFISLYILVIGLIGMVVVGIYTVKNRRR